MSNIWLTSDLHLGHKNILKFCNRPYSSLEEMHYKMFEGFNSIIKPNDLVYCLGDFSFDNPLQFTKRLNGKWHLIRGNHDHKQHVVGAFEWVKDVFMLKSKDYMVFMSHYAHRIWPQSHYGCYHAFGHSHGNLPNQGRSMDVGIDANNYLPVALEDFIKKLEKEPYGIHHERSL